MLGYAHFKGHADKYMMIRVNGMNCGTVCF